MNIPHTPLLDECARKFGISVIRYDTTDSTNTRAKEYYKSERKASPAIFITRAQSAGRGTRGRSFESPIDSGLYISFLFYPDLSAVDAAHLTTYAATRVCRAIDRISNGTAEAPRIKWVNDIYIGEKKLSGILTEGAPDEQGNLCYAVVGIGINLKSGALSNELADIATSLEEHSIFTDADTLAAILTEEFFGGLDTLASPEVMKEYRERSMLIGRRVTVAAGDTVECVTVTDIGDDGALIVREDGGAVRSYLSADARLIKNK